MIKPKRPHCRTANWSAHNTAPLNRESLLIWLDEEMAWYAPPEGGPERPAVSLNAAFQFCLSVKVLFKRPLRQSARMVGSMLRLAGLDWAVPDFSTRSRRQRTLKVNILYRRASRR